MILRFLAGLMLLWLFGFLAFAFTLPRPAADLHETDAIVVLTGSAGRIERGLALLRAGQGKQLLVSGVDRDVRPIEFAKLYKVSSRQMRCCVTLGRQAVDTRSNAVEATNWLAEHDYSSVRLITADWHMRRAYFELANELDRPVTILSDAVPTRPSLLALLREYHKYVLRRGAALMGL